MRGSDLSGEENVAMSKSGFLRWTAIGVVTLGVTAGIIVAGMVRLSLPEEDGSRVLPGLSASVEIEFDAHHIPKIRAENRRDAYEALGYATARDRLFQMDLSRRAASGRLAEVFGREAVTMDMRARTSGFGRVASRVFEAMSLEQRDVLVAYSAGVNKAVSEMRMLPVEFIYFGYRPEPWRPEDSALVLLGLSAKTSDSAMQERMASVMRRALPETVLAFLSPSGNCYNERLAPRGPLHCAADAPAPFDEIAELLRLADKKKTSGLVAEPELLQGSNAWVVGGRKTGDGRAIMANDMHLGLSAPGIFYRAELNYGGVRLGGLTVPGAPLVVTGSNGSVAWGFTSVAGDFIDLVRIEPTAEPDKYRGPEGALPFVTRNETIEIRGARARELAIRETIWGPVSSEKLLDDEVAIRWTILDPAATNFELMNIDRVGDVREAMSLFHRAGGPPLNVLLADRAGSIAWTMMGKLPKRFGFDGRYSESWAEGDKGWRGFFAAEEVPSIVDPPSGFLVNTNNRMPGVAAFGPDIGHDYYGGYRAWRVSELLRERMRVAESDMLALQLDTVTEFYRYYQALALRVLASRSGDHPRLAEIRRSMEHWDGKAESESVGLPLLVEFRRELVDAVISPIMTRCRELDSSFRYGWSGVDVPLQRIIESDRDDLLPDRAYRDWPSFITAILETSAQSLVKKAGVASIDGLTWGALSKVRVAHPLLGGLPVIGQFFNMPVEPQRGCVECVRYAASRSGASARMVVAPDHEKDGILELPAGQSGQVGSPYYGDQEASWVAGLPAVFLAGESVRKLTLLPDHAAVSAQR
ncbi:Penicillin+acylase+2+proenzyme [Methylocapsa aurea]|uniref:penicillin acylase family protein n=1 Tax=Methylocapsa aurea TaxID=663610 RepID=UPI003D18D367